MNQMCRKSSLYLALHHLLLLFSILFMAVPPAHSTDVLARAEWRRFDPVSIGLGGMVTCLAEGDNEIWFGTRRGVGRIVGGFLDAPLPDRLWQVTALAVIGEHLWIGTHRHGLWLFDTKSRALQRVDGTDRAVAHLKAVGNHVVYIVGGMAYRIENASPVLLDEGVSCADIDANKMVLAIQGQLKVIRFESPLDFKVPVGSPVSSIALTGKGALVQSGSSLAFWDESWTQHLISHTSSGAWAYDSSEHGVWYIGGDRRLIFNGLTALADRIFSWDTGPEPVSIVGLLLDKQRNLWAASHDGLYASHPQWRQTQELRPEVGSIDGIFEDAGGFLWLASEQGLSKMNPSDGSVTRFAEDEMLDLTGDSRQLVALGKEHLYHIALPDGLPRKTALPSALTEGTLCLDRSGRVFVFSERGIFRHEDTTVRKVVAGPLPRVQVSIEGAHHFWLASPEGLFSWRLGQQPLLRSAGTIFHLANASNGGVWAAGLDGLLQVVDQPQQPQISRIEYPDGPIFAVIEAGPKSLWLSTPTGLAYLNTASGRWRSVGDAFGLAHGGGSRNLIRLREGQLVYARDAVIHTLFPPSGKDSDDAGWMLQTRASSQAGSPIDSDTATVDIRWPVPLPATIPRLSYRFKDTESWQALSATGSLSLPGERHELSLRDFSQGSSNGYNQQSCPIQGPPFWPRFFFVSLALVSALTIIIILFRLKLRRGIAKVREQQSVVLATTAHELRAPLAGITGLAEAMLDRHLDMDVDLKRDLTHIASTARRLSRLADEMREHHGFSTGGELRRGPVSLHSLVERVFVQFDIEKLAQEGTRFINQIPQNLPALDGDADRLEQVFLNLTTNALKYAGGSDIYVQAEERDDKIRVVVGDHGPGIPEEQREQIFEPFERGEQGATGHGLGLAITRAILLKHGSQIEVHSEPGHGARFIFSLPLYQGLTEETRPRGPMANVSARSSSDTHPMILIVDDDPTNRRVIRSYLDSRPYQLVEASDGPGALTYLAESANHVDLILLDIMMPKMSGFEVCQHIRETSPMDKLPIIFLTARGDRADVVRGLKEGANDYLVKPIFKEELIERVEIHLKLKEINSLLEREKNLMAREMEIERLVRLSKEAELRLLHAQMKPHFLQNILNSVLYSCLSEQIEDAVFILKRLSFLMRQSFNATPNGWWSLDKELQITQAYCDLQKQRFEERLEFHFPEKAPWFDHEVPCFLIQPLVENAVEHGLEVREEGVCVRVEVQQEEDGLLVTVSNEGPPLPLPFRELISEEHAMGNIDRRLYMLFKERLQHTYRDQRHHFSFHLKLRHKKNPPLASEAGLVG